MRVDLHVHTAASDGQYSPAEVVAMARDAGIQVLAVTDHDTIDGVEEACKAGDSLGVMVLRGVELAANNARHMHILGLGFRERCPELEAVCKSLKTSREERNIRILTYLQEKGLELSLEDVQGQATGGVIGRPHFAQAMLQRGYVASTREAFDRYLDTEEYQKIERIKLDAAQCIAAIHSAGGKAVLAHPYQLGFSDEQLERTIRQLLEWGLDGLECYYPKHTPQQQARYLQLAETYQLFVTAGSDFHGPLVHPDDRLRPVELEVTSLLPSKGSTDDAGL